MKEDWFIDGYRDYFEGVCGVYLESPEEAVAPYTTWSGRQESMLDIALWIDHAILDRDETYQEYLKDQAKELSRRSEYEDVSEFE